MPRNAYITGTGLYAPEHYVDNEEVSNILNEDVQEFMGVIGINKRRLLPEGESTTHLAVRAGKQALEKAGVEAKDVDVLILSTDTPDIISPQSSAAVAGELGMAWDATFLDINSSCTGFVAAAEVASALIRSGQHNRVLVIAAYAMTPFAPMEKGKFFAVFSDGAGAALFEATEEDRGYVASHFISDGSHWASLGIYVGGTRYPATAEALQGQGEVPPGLTFFRGELINRNPDYWPIIIQKTLDKAGLTKEDPKLYIFTQINEYAIKETCNNLGIPFEKTHNIMGEYGYTGNACIIMALHDALEQGRVQAGDLVVLTASGVGYTMSSILFRL